MYDTALFWTSYNANSSHGIHMQSSSKVLQYSVECPGKARRNDKGLIHALHETVQALKLRLFCPKLYLVALHCPHHRLNGRSHV